MCLVLFAPFASSINIAIDVGSSSFRSAFTDGAGAPQVCTTAQSKRSFPAFIAFRAKPTFNTSLPTTITEDDVEFLQADFGEKALGALDVRPHMGTGFFAAFSGVGNVTADSRAGRLFVARSPARVPFNDCVPVFLKAYLESVVGNRTIEHVGMVFPAHFTLGQRLLFTESLALCTSAPSSEFDDVDAVSTLYITENQPQGRHTVLFVDVGATSLKSYAVEFSGNTAKRLTYVVDTEHGGAFLTGDLVNLLRQKIGVTNTTGAEDRRLFNAAERAKIALSTDRSATVLVENIGGIDRSATVERAEYENDFVSGGLAQAVVNVAKKASAGISVNEVELLGGSSKIPLIESALKLALKVGSVGRSLPADDAIVLGAAHAIQTSLNQSVRGPPDVSQGGQLFNISMILGEGTYQICIAGQDCNTRLSFPGLNNRMSLTFAESDLTLGVDPLTLKYRISRNIEGNVTLNFRSRPFRFLGIDRCNATCEPGKFLIMNGPKVQEEIVRLFSDPFARTRRVEKLHDEVGAFATRVLDEIAKNQTVRFFTNHTQRLDIIRCVEPHRDWVRSPAVAKLSDPRNFTAHLKEIKVCVAPVYRRITENRTFFTNADKLYQAIQRGKYLLDKWRSREIPGDGPDLRRFGDRMLKCEIWFNKSLDENIQTPGWTFAPIKPKTWLDKYTEFNHELQQMVARFGSGSMPRMMKGDGTQPTAEELKELNQMPFMKSYKELDKKRELAREGTPPEEDL
jgi:hypothetical protein